MSAEGGKEKKKAYTTDNFTSKKIRGKRPLR